MAVDAGFVTKSGAWYSYGEERIGQGREKAREFLAENADVLAAIEAKVREKHNAKRPVVIDQQEEEEPPEDL